MNSSASLTILATAFVLGLAAPAQAALRTFVSGIGNDASATCGRAAPCRTFAVAITRTDAGGEIIVLDAAGYGSVFIGKAISIINDGVGEAGVRTDTVDGTAIEIAAGLNDAVYLRGLTIEGLGTAAYGILFHSGKSLTVQNCTIRKFKIGGIGFAPAVLSSLAVSNTLLADIATIGSTAGAGISMHGSANAVLTRVEAYNNNYGIRIVGESAEVFNVTVADSVVANGRIGFHVISEKGARANLLLVRSVAANNTWGIRAAGANAIVRSAGSTVTGNATGWSVTSGAVLQSYGDNSIDGNTDDGGFPPTIPTR